MQNFGRPNSLDRSTWLICGLILTFLAGCGREAQQNQADPKTSFESLVKQLLPAIGNAFAAGIPGQKDAIIYETRDGHTYDIRKTDSLVSPYEGSLVIPIKSARWKSSHAEISSGLTEIEAIFAMQNDKWIVTSLRGKRAIKYGLRSEGQEDQMNWSGDISKEEATLMTTFSTLTANAQR